MKKEDLLFCGNVTYLVAKFYFVIWPYAWPLLWAFLSPSMPHLAPPPFI